MYCIANGNYTCPSICRAFFVVTRPFVGERVLALGDGREVSLTDETLSAIRDVTERYERAAFAANRVGHETATTAIDAVSSLVGDERSSE